MLYLSIIYNLNSLTVAAPFLTTIEAASEYNPIK